MHHWFYVIWRSFRISLAFSSCEGHTFSGYIQVAARELGCSFYLVSQPSIGLPYIWLKTSKLSWLFSLTEWTFSKLAEQREWQNKIDLSWLFMSASVVTEWTFISPTLLLLTYMHKAGFSKGPPRHQQWLLGDLWPDCRASILSLQSVSLSWTNKKQLPVSPPVCTK